MIKISGAQKTLDMLKSAVSTKIQEEQRKASLKLIEKLREVTPVDTGNARDSWRLEGDAIVNDAPYISNLNQGSSKQAPAYFVESTVMSQPGIKPDGLVVKYVD